MLTNVPRPQKTRRVDFIILCSFSSDRTTEMVDVTGVQYFPSTKKRAFATYMKATCVDLQLFYSSPPPPACLWAKTRAHRRHRPFHPEGLTLGPAFVQPGCGPRAEIRRQISL